MAARYWVGGTGNWDAATTTHWGSASGVADNASVPTSADNVIFDTLSNATAYTCTITATATCADITIGNPLVGNLTLAGSSAMSVYGSFNIANITRTYSGAITFRATATGKTLTFNGETMGSSTTFDGVGGGWTLQDAWNNTGFSITLTNGDLNINSQTVTCLSFSSANSNTRALTLGTATINITGGWSFNPSTSMTFSGASSTISHTGGNGLTFSGGGLTYGTLIVANTNTAAQVINNSNTFTTLTITGPANKTYGLTLGAGTIQTISGTLTISGNSVVNRLLISTDTPGTTATLSAGTVTLSNVDLQDITGAGAGSWNLSAITGLSGDCGGNSGITLTTPATQTATGTVSFTWSTHGWTSRVPLPQDDVVINNAFGVSQSITADMPRLGKGIDFTGATYTTGLGFANSIACTLFGSLTLITGMTVSGGGGLLTFAGRGAYTLTNAGCNWAKSMTVNAPGGSLTLQDAIVMSVIFTLTRGTFDANNQNVTLAIFSSSNSNTRTLTMGSGTWTLTVNNNTAWSTATVTGLTLNRGSAGVVLNYAGSAGTRNINVGALAEGSAVTFYITGGTDTVAVIGSQLNLDFTGFAGTFSNGARTIYGNLTVSTGMTLTAGANATTFASTSGTKTITSNGKTLDFPIIFSGVGGTWQTSGTLTMGSTRTMTLTSGTFDANNQNISIGLFDGSGSSTRALTMGSGTWSLTGTGTVWNTNVATGLTLNAGTSIVDVNANTAVARTVIGNSTARLVTFKISAGTGTVTPNSLYVDDLNFTGFAGTFGVGVVDLTGNLTLVSGMTVSDGANVVTFSSTSGTKTITTNGVSFSRPMTFNGVGGTWELQDALTGGAGRRVIVTNGHLDFNDNNVTIGLITVSSGATLTLGAMTLELTGTGSTVANIDAGATINAGLSTIKITDSTSANNTLALGSKTYHDLWWARGASTGSNTLTGSNTFNDYKDDGSVAHSLIFTNSISTQVETFTVSGSAGQLITIASTGTAVHTLTAPSRSNASPISCDYLDIQHSVAVQANTWYAGNNSVDNQAVATAGSGWVFSAPIVVGGQNSGFFAFM